MSDEKKPTTQENLMGCFWGWLMLMFALFLLWVIGGAFLGLGGI